MTFRTAVAVGLSTLLAAFAQVGVAATEPSAPQPLSFSHATPVDAVILADESGSIVPDELAGERQAATAIVQAAWSPQSRIAIYGFGSAPTGNHGGAVAAVDELCGPTPASLAGVGTLTRCAGKISLRLPGQDNTDFASAFTVAQDLLSSLSSPGETQRPKLVFLLTDGVLDLDGPIGLAPGPSTKAAQQMLKSQILPHMKTLGIQIWPVGFGQADKTELGLFAQDGAQANGCPEGTGGTPHAILEGAAGEILREQVQAQLLTVFATASCGTITPGGWVTVPAAGSLSVPVAINPLTTDGSIVVNKSDPNVTVTYVDPNRARLSDTCQPSGVLDGAAYQLATGGAGFTQEALRLDNPVTGGWTVTFHNPTTVAQRVDVSVVWQGEVNPNLTFSPTTGDSGHAVTLQVSPTFGDKRISLADLAALSASFTVQWTPGGPVEHLPATLDRSTSEFTHSVPVPPGQSGTARVTATVREAGVQGTISSPLSYQPGGGLSVTLDKTNRVRVDPGGSFTVNAQVSNVDNVRQPTASIEFLSGIVGQDVVISGPTRPVQVGSGGQKVPVTFTFGKLTRGEVEGTIYWEVTGTTGQHPAGLLDVTVEPAPPPPTPWYEWWWLWTALALLLAGGLGGRYARRRRQENARLAAEKLARQQAAEQVAAIERAHRDVQDAGVALVRRGKPGNAHFIHWSGGERQERWFTVEGRAGVPVLVETTPHPGLLLLRGDPADGTFLVTAHGAPAPGAATASTGTGDGAAEPAPEAAPAPAPEIRVGHENLPYDLPPGAGFEDCQLVLTKGHQASGPAAVARDDGLIYHPEPYPDTWPSPALHDEDYTRLDPIDYDDDGPGNSGADQ